MASESSYTYIETETTLISSLGACYWEEAPNWQKQLNISDALGNSERRIKGYFEDSDSFNMSEDNPLWLFNSYKNSIQQLDVIRNTLSLQTADIINLFIYCAGHGLRKENNSFHLAIRGTRPSNAFNNSISFKDLAIELKEAARNRKTIRIYLILDCCFSEIAFKDFVEYLGPKCNLVMLTASGADEFALAAPEMKYTFFSSSIIHFLYNYEKETVLSFDKLHELSLLYFEKSTVYLSKAIPTPRIHKLGKTYIANRKILPVIKKQEEQVAPKQNLLNKVFSYIENSWRTLTIFTALGCVFWGYSSIVRQEKITQAINTPICNVETVKQEISFNITGYPNSSHNVMLDIFNQTKNGQEYPNKWIEICGKKGFNAPDNTKVTLSIFKRKTLEKGDYRAELWVRVASDDELCVLTVKNSKPRIKISEPCRINY